MKKTFLMTTIIVITAVIGDAHAKFSPDQCDYINKCYDPYKIDDDLVSAADECCGGYDEPEYSDCIEVGIGGYDPTYCEPFSSITSCTPGQGYNSLSNTCHTCSSGEYSIYETLESGYDETLLIPNYYCEPCPVYYPKDSGDYAYAYPSSTPGSTKESNCYISKKQTWEFSDTSGQGTASFSQDCYYE